MAEISNCISTERHAHFLFTELMNQYQVRTIFFVDKNSISGCHCFANIVCIAQLEVNGFFQMQLVHYIKYIQKLNQKIYRNCLGNYQVANHIWISQFACRKEIAKRIAKLFNCTMDKLLCKRLDCCVYDWMYSCPN